MKPVCPRSIEREINHSYIFTSKFLSQRFWEEYFSDSQDESKNCIPLFKFDDAKVQSEIENNQKSEIIHIKSIEIIKENEVKKRGPRSMKFNRWNKRDNARMFKIINILISKNKISNKFIEDPDELDMTKDAKDFKALTTAIKWKNSYNDLKKEDPESFNIRRSNRQRLWTTKEDCLWKILDIKGWLRPYHARIPR